MLWFVYETDYPDEGATVVEAEDASTACLAADGDAADYSARPVTVADVERLRKEAEAAARSPIASDAFMRIAHLVVPVGKAYTVGRVVDEVCARLARPLASEAEAERLREEVAALRAERGRDAVTVADALEAIAVLARKSSKRADRARKCARRAHRREAKARDLHLALDRIVADLLPPV